MPGAELYWHDSGVTRVESTLLSVALAAVLTLAAYTNVLLVAAVIVIIQLMIATAPSPANEAGRSVHAPRFGAAAVAGIIATVITLWPGLLLGADGTSAGNIGRIDSGVFAGLAPAMAAGVIVALLSQMLRRDGRGSLVLTTGHAVTLCAFAVLAIGWIGAAESLGGAPVVAVSSIALSATLLVWLVPFQRWIAASLAVVAAATAGGVSAPFLGDTADMTWLFGTLAGVGIATFGILGQVLGRAWCSGRRHVSSGWGFPGALSLALCAPIVFVAGQLLGASFSLS